MNFKKNTVGLTSSEWYLNKYGSNHPIMSSKHTATQSHGIYGMNIHNETVATYSNDFFVNKLAAKGITISTPPMQSATMSARRSMSATMSARHMLSSGTQSKGSTQSFSQMAKMKMAEPLPTHDVKNDFKKMPFMNKNVGMTFSKVDFTSKRTGTASNANLTNFAAKISNIKAKFAANANYNKKFYTKVPTDTPQLDNTNFVDFVAKVGDVLADNAKRLIQLNKVTVNNNRVTDVNYVLNTGDLVRVGLIGHYLNNNKGIAIVK